MPHRKRDIQENTNSPSIRPHCLYPTWSSFYSWQSPMKGRFPTYSKFKKASHTHFYLWKSHQIKSHSIIFLQLLVASWFLAIVSTYAYVWREAYETEWQHPQSWSLDERKVKLWCSSNRGYSLKSYQNNTITVISLFWNWPINHFVTSLHLYIIFNLTLKIRFFLFIANMV